MRNKKQARANYWLAPALLEGVADFAGDRARGYVVRTRERREEVVQRVLVGDVDCRKPHAHFVLVAMKEIVFAERHIEEVSGLNTRRIVIVISGVGRRNFEQ